MTKPATLPAKIRRQIESAMTRLAQAKADEKNAKTTKSEVKDEILPLMIAYNIKSHEAEGVGKLVQKTNSGSSISADKLRVALLTRGVDPEVITKAIDEATKSWSSPYLDLVIPK